MWPPMSDLAPHWRAQAPAGLTAHLALLELGPEGVVQIRTLLLHCK